MHKKTSTFGIRNAQSKKKAILNYTTGDCLTFYASYIIIIASPYHPILCRMARTQPLQTLNSIIMWRANWIIDFKIGFVRWNYITSALCKHTYACILNADSIQLRNFASSAAKRKKNRKKKNTKDTHETQSNKFFCAICMIGFVDVWNIIFYYLSGRLGWRTYPPRIFMVCNACDIFALGDGDYSICSSYSYRRRTDRDPSIRIHSVIN